MKDHLQELRSLKLAYREGGDLREVIAGTLAKTSLLPSNSEDFINALQALKAEVEELAQQFLKGTIDRNTYTLKWDQMVRDTMQVIDQMEQALTDQDTH